MKITLYISLFTLFVISALGTILTVGEERKPNTNTDAAMSVIMNAIVIWAISYILFA